MKVSALWLEDEPGTLTFEQQVVRNDVDELVSAEDAESGIILVNKCVFQLIIVDLILPRTVQDKANCHADEAAGLWFIEGVRDPTRLGATASDTRVLVVTAVVRDDTRRNVVKLLQAPEDYFLKPLCRNPVSFADRVQQICKNLHSLNDHMR